MFHKREFMQPVSHMVYSRNNCKRIDGWGEIPK